MQLKRELISFSIASLLAPAFIIAAAAAVFLSSETASSQRERLVSISERILNDIGNLEEDVLSKAREMTERPYVIDKLYIYSKYWDLISSSTLQYDVATLRATVESYLVGSRIDATAIYRSDGSRFIRILSFGNVTGVPETLFRNETGSRFGKAQYTQERFGLSMNHLYPVFSKGKIVGLFLLQMHIDEAMITRLARQYDAELGIRLAGGFSFFSVPELINTIATDETADEDGFFSVQMNGQKYRFLRVRLTDENGDIGALYVGSNRVSFWGESGGIVGRLFLLSLFCLLIPVGFYIWTGTTLVRSIVTLFNGTEAVRRGDFGARLILPKRKDEVSGLYQNFNEMMETLERNRSRLESRNEQLTLMNSYIDAVFHSLQIVTIVIDANRTILLMNAGGRIELDVPDEPAGRDIYSLPLFGDKREQVESALRRARTESGPTESPAVEWNGKTYSLDIFPMDDSPVDTILVLIDITERLSLETALVRSEALATMGRFAADIAHEVNNPMGIILNHVQLLQTGRLSEEQQKTFLDRMESEIHRVNKLLKNLLGGAVSEELSLEPLDLGELARTALDLFDLKFQRKEIRYGLIRLAPEQASRIRGNRDALMQVFYNLLNNSIDSIDGTEGFIEITIRCEEGYVAVDIRDNGTGMTQETQAKAFEPFYSEKRGKGAGVGLAVSERLIRRQHGTISIESTIGGGTTVTFRMPSEANDGP